MILVLFCIRRQRETARRWPLSMFPVFIVRPAPFALRHKTHDSNELLLPRLVKDLSDARCGALYLVCGQTCNEEYCPPLPLLLLSLFPAAVPGGSLARLYHGPSLKLRSQFCGGLTSSFTDAGKGHASTRPESDPRRGRLRVVDCCSDPYITWMMVVSPFSLDRFHGSEERIGSVEDLFPLVIRGK
jgi:hypothetical protein